MSGKLCGRGPYCHCVAERNEEERLTEEHDEPYDNGKQTLESLQEGFVSAETHGAGNR